ncbi:MAG: 5-formyltetrahydrofolate cyclo-ligase [Gammaproteobacteria bacterium]
MNSAELRSKLVRQRRALPPQLAHQAGYAASVHAWQLPVMQRARRIAAYLAVNSEIDCGALIETAWSRGREVYLPVLQGQGLFFRRYRPKSLLTPNRFAIPEPSEEPLLRATALDVVIAPLVAFDRVGNRLGMGGGYYDRTFSFLRYRKSWRHPRLLGFAYDMQAVNSLPAQSWDVPLDAVVTETSKYEFLRK